jgi:hypothetical protein
MIAGQIRRRAGVARDSLLSQFVTGEQRQLLEQLD